MADSKPLCTCALAEPPGGMTTLNKERPFAPAVLPEMPGKMGRDCFDSVVSTPRTVTISFPSRSPMMVGSAEACAKRRPHAARPSKSLVCIEVSFGQASDGLRRFLSLLLGADELGQLGSP